MTRKELKELVSNAIIQGGDPIEVASCVLDAIDAFCEEVLADAKEIAALLDKASSSE